ncbi:MAG: M50 family metallopeptidase [Pseudomonadota bacterium]
MSATLPHTKDRAARLNPTQFWGLVVIIFVVLQFPLVRIPVLFLSTWAHELGHGLGALVTGGAFYELTIFPNFSGLASVGVTSDVSQAVVIILGLLGPSLLGVFMIGLTRGLHWPRAALIIMALMMGLSLIWAANLFTLLTIGSGAALFGLMAKFLPDRVTVMVAHIVAIALCLNALTGFGYFFMGNAEIAGDMYRSDTGVLAEIWVGPYWFWGGVMVLLSVLTLIIGVVLSDRWARRHPPERE